MKRVERRLFRINDELALLSEERALIEAELEAHRHLDDDAQRDAVLGLEALEATLTRDDVKRFYRVLGRLDARLNRLRAQREKLLTRITSIE